jgi:drug/metabolite transporter (DMT)-like permease
MKTETGPNPSRLGVMTAFAAVYIVWGATYLAIRMGVATLPPFLMAAARFLVAGALLLGWTWLRGATLPSFRQWKNSAIAGTLLLLGGNGLVCWAEQTVNSSLAALIIAASPMWFALFEWVRPGGRRPTPITSLGLIVGFSGVALLVLHTPHGPGSASSSTSVPGVVALIVACAAWAGGSIFSKHSDKPESPWVSTAAQMLTGGAALLTVSLLTGEPGRFSFDQVSQRSLLAFLYLVIFGSWIGFGAYVWLLQNCAPTKVATYAYVNPVIATLLGWWVLDEPLTTGTGLAALVILGGVLIVQWPRTRMPKPAPAPVVEALSPCESNGKA